MFHPEQAKRLHSLLRSGAKVIIVSGPLGCGKSYMIDRVCRHLRVTVDQVSPDSVHNGDFVTEIQTQSLTGEQKVLVLDHVESFNTERQGSLTKVLKVLDRTRVPLILTCDDIYSQQLKSLRSRVNLGGQVKRSRAGTPKVVKYPLIKLFPPSTHKARTAVQTRAQELGLEIHPDDIEESLSYSGNDVRQAIVGIEFGGDTYDATRVNKKMMFDSAQACFKSGRSFRQCMNSVEDDPQMIPLFLHENYPRFSQGLEELDRASKRSSDADIFGEQFWLSKVKNTLWASIPCSCSKTQGRVQFPTILSHFSTRGKVLNPDGRIVEQGLASRLHEIETSGLEGSERTEAIREVKRRMVHMGLTTENVYNTRQGSTLQTKTKASFSRLKV